MTKAQSQLLEFTGKVAIFLAGFISFVWCVWALFTGGTIPKTPAFVYLQPYQAEWIHINLPVMSRAWDVLTLPLYPFLALVLFLVYDWMQVRDREWTEWFMTDLSMSALIGYAFSFFLIILVNKIGWSNLFLMIVVCLIATQAIAFILRVIESESTVSSIAATLLGTLVGWTVSFSLLVSGFTLGLLVLLAISLGVLAVIGARVVYLAVRSWLKNPEEPEPQPPKKEKKVRKPALAA